MAIRCGKRSDRILDHFQGDRRLDHEIRSVFSADFDHLQTMDGSLLIAALKLSLSFSVQSRLFHLFGAPPDGAVGLQIDAWAVRRWPDRRTYPGTIIYWKIHLRLAAVKPLPLAIRSAGMRCKLPVSGNNMDFAFPISPLDPSGDQATPKGFGMHYFFSETLCGLWAHSPLVAGTRSMGRRVLRSRQQRHLTPSSRKPTVTREFHAPG